ncbi:hypothetical protein KVV02_002565 [Mortierella alpina]|uniref:Uncharacterized protein n=1 Tax=Mortierella alpina TaxID=64518 RepID=A0A9P8A4S8_MORAP|nr:hypothetical protein KVV02_002565 [Mortierella alpina]
MDSTSTTPSTLWHPVAGIRLQSVSVADRKNIWGVTLDLQVCKLNPETQKWILVAVNSEIVNRSRFSASSAQSAITNTSISSLASSTPSSASSFFATKKISSLLPSLRLSSGASFQESSHQQQQQEQQQKQDQHEQQQEKGNGLSLPMQRQGSLPLSESETDADTTVQVSAASDGTVVRLDSTQKAWYLIAPHDHADFEKDVIWIDLGHFWKVVSVASMSQIWGLSESGDIYYGTSDSFVQLESSVTSGAGYDKPTFTHIAVGHDNVVLATDAHSGIVFRLKTHPTASHPPVWTAMPGTGTAAAAGTGLHFRSCSLSSANFIVGVTLDGHVYRFTHGAWVSLGGGAKISSVGIGADGYVLGVDRDGDLTGCQLQDTVTIPRRVSSRGIQLSQYKMKDSSAPSSPQAPNAPNIPTTPRLQAVSKRPMASPRELFEMAATTHRGHVDDEEPTVELGGPPRSSSPLSRSDTYTRYSLARTESQLSKRSYASDLPSATTPTGLNILQQQRAGSPTPGPYGAPSASNKPLPLRIQTKGVGLSGRQLIHADEFAGDSYFSSRPHTTSSMDGHSSPPTHTAYDEGPYSAKSHASPVLRTSSPHSPRSPYLDLAWQNSARSSHPDSPSTPGVASQEFPQGYTTAPRIGSGQFEGKQRFSGTSSSGDSPVAYSPAKQRILEKALSRSRSFQSQRSHSSAPDGDTSRSSMQGNNDNDDKDTTGDAALVRSLSSQLQPHVEPNELISVARPTASETLTEHDDDVDIQHQLTSTDSRPIISPSNQQPKGPGPSLLSELPAQTSEMIQQEKGGDVNMDVNIEETRPPDKENLNETTQQPSAGWEPYKSEWTQGGSDDYRDQVPPTTRTNIGRALSASHQFWQSQEAHLSPPLPSSHLSSQDQIGLQPFSPDINHGTLSDPNQKQVLGPDSDADLQQDQDPEHDLDLEYYLSTPGLGSTHRPSDSSDILMQEQQEYLRLTRLRSRQSYAFAAFKNDKNNSKYFNTLKAFGGDNGFGIDEKTELGLDPSTVGEQEQQQQYQQYDYKGERQEVEHQHYSSDPTPQDPTPEAISSAFQRHPSSSMGLFKKKRVQVPPVVVKANADEEANSRPSYSSSHLQQYVDTLAAQATAVDSRKDVPMITISNGSLGDGSAAAADAAAPSGGGGTGTGGVGEIPTPTLTATSSADIADGRTSLSGHPRGPDTGVVHRSYEQLRTGIQGEDEQGRWIGGTSANDTTLHHYDPEIHHKSKCCIIL